MYGRLMPKPTVTGKSQTIIPRDVRNQLNPSLGDRLRPVIVEDSRAPLSLASIDTSELQGILTPPARPVSVEGMNQAIRKRGGR
jgi:bifunctional DNA-binding transcriptional regulator/antitoxin component of YhaV-PrlF toxin-antitoxin module